MDFGQILGSLIGGKMGGGGGGGAGGNILGDLLGSALGGGGQRHAPAGSGMAPGAGRSSGGLQDMLRDAYGQYQKRPGIPGECSDPSHAGVATGGSELNDARAQLYIRSMIQATKADGRLDEQEKQAIMGRLGQVTQEEVNFVQAELNRDVSVRDFAWSVPLGEEQNVYTMALMAIRLDENSEAQYLGELAHGLRLQPSVCNQIHRQYNAPTIFK